MMIWSLLIINLIVMLIHESGFIDYIDDWVSKKWKFHHLPKIMVCALCQTFWLGILYILLTGQFTLPGILLCLVNAHLSEVTQGIFRIVKKAVFDMLSWLDNVL